MLRTSALARDDSRRKPQTELHTPLVLVVDDHFDTRELLRYVIEMNGCRVAEASDGEEAVRLAETILPDLILMDTSLPGIDGLMATERIRKLKNLRKVPIIFLSGHASPQSREMALAAGGDGYFVKPVGLSELELALARYVTVLPRILTVKDLNLGGA